MEKLNDIEIQQQLMKEIKATFILIAIVAVWHVGFAFLLDGIDVMVFGMPLWFFVSTIGAFAISVVGVVVLLKKVFVNFELEEEIEDELVQEGSQGQTDEVILESTSEQCLEGGDVV